MELKDNVKIIRMDQDIENLGLAEEEKPLPKVVRSKPP